mmetsp:Transcript_13098/g.40344  ORF Transcript_13098/g.40344 Transcript_13098/m.40344 type:complete len:110 (-) Transcript_13098:488-817(-)
MTFLQVPSSIFLQTAFRTRLLERQQMWQKLDATALLNLFGLCFFETPPSALRPSGLRTRVGLHALVGLMHPSGLKQLSGLENFPDMSRRTCRLELSDRKEVGESVCSAS